MLQNFSFFVFLRMWISNRPTKAIHTFLSLRILLFIAVEHGFEISPNQENISMFVYHTGSMNDTHWPKHFLISDISMKKVNILQFIAVAWHYLWQISSQSWCLGPSLFSPVQFGVSLPHVTLKHWLQKAESGNRKILKQLMTNLNTKICSDVVDWLALLVLGYVIF